MFGAWQATPLVVDGIMYITQRPNDVIALDAKTGRVFWIYRHNTLADQRACCGSNNRGVAILGDTLFMGTLDAHLVALDAKTGQRSGTSRSPITKPGYSITLAPLVVKDKVIVGVGGGEFGIRGFVAALRREDRQGSCGASTRFPRPGEPGHETWKRRRLEDRRRIGLADRLVRPALNLTYWGVGNPGPDWNAEQRPGDNLYTDSVVALDPDTGQLKWHFQFTPNDPYDYDSVQVPVLADMDWNGTPTKVMLWANRNGFFYVLDRETGKFLLGKPFVKVNWASGLDENGRPIQTPQPPGAADLARQPGRDQLVFAVLQPAHRTVLLSAWENYAHDLRAGSRRVSGRPLLPGGGIITVYGPVPNATPMPTLRRGPINNWTEAVGTGAVLAIDPQTGERKWEFDDDRRHRQRHPDHRVGPAVHRRPRRAISRRSTRAPARCCGRPVSAARSSARRSATWSTASNTCR